MGRPSKLTPESQKAICDAIKVGATREVAARAAGITKTSLTNWITRARNERERLEQKGARVRKREQPYLAFLAALELAEAEGEVELLEEIKADGATGAKWILARRHPDRWAEISKREVSGPKGEPVAIKHTISEIVVEMPPDESVQG